ncbi:acyl-CoA dehydrogenase family protein [Kutzneria sp. NPDC051319]|uniref:acyl-CoA dehydrogenase family protein n=1 Tax=Kutzneria sp. NPDC051319 TaxID=3155047 RepID=UPI0034304DCD
MAEQRRIRERLVAALEAVVLPNADDWEARRHIPPDGWRLLAEHGLLGVPHSGPGFQETAVLMEELGRTGYAGIRAAVAVHACMATFYLARFGSPQQHERFLAPARRGEQIAALALSESDAGTDLNNLATRADPDGHGGYRVSGRKSYVANGSQAGFYICLARTRTTAKPGRALGGSGLLIIDADTPGLTVTPQPMLGWRAADMCEITLADVRVSGDRLIGKAGHTLSYLMAALDFERLVAGLLAIGGAAHAIAATRSFTRHRHLGGAPLAANQTVRHALADLVAELEVVRCYARRAAIRYGQGRLETDVASIVKLRATELAVSASRVCMQYHGAAGYSDDSVAARIYRDAAAATIAAGPNELMRDIIFETTEEASCTSSC